MRKTRRIALLVAASCSLGGGLAIALQTPDGDPEVVELLSGISFAPNKNNIDLVMGEAAVEDLITIAADDSDQGLRLRALRALGQYALSPDKASASAALRAGIADFERAQIGVELLYLRASLLSLARLEAELAVPDLSILLGHSSRDIRAASAQALAITGSEAALQPLLDQALVEGELQVQLAISDALFQLGSTN